MRVEEEIVHACCERPSTHAPCPTPANMPTLATTCWWVSSLTCERVVARHTLSTTLTFLVLIKELRSRHPLGSLPPFQSSPPALSGFGINWMEGISPSPPMRHHQRLRFAGFSPRSADVQRHLFSSCFLSLSMFSIIVFRRLRGVRKALTTASQRPETGEERRPFSRDRGWSAPTKLREYKPSWCARNPYLATQARTRWWHLSCSLSRTIYIRSPTSQ